MLKGICVLFIFLVNMHVYANDCNESNDLAINALCDERIFSDLIEIEGFLLDGELRKETGVYYSDPQMSVGDLNNDGNDEVLLTSPGCSRNCEHILIIQEKYGYRFIGVFQGVSVVADKIPQTFPIGEENREEWNGFKYLATYNYGGRIGVGSYTYSAFNGKIYETIGSLHFDTSLLSGK